MSFDWQVSRILKHKKTLPISRQGFENYLKFKLESVKDLPNKIHQHHHLHLDFNLSVTVLKVQLQRFCK